MSGGKKHSKSDLKLQIVSDLHLEFRPDDLDFLVPSAPILCLLGDVCVIGTNEDFKVYKKFIETIYDKYDLILHVPGNHEYYNQTMKGKDTNCTMERINLRLRNFAKKKAKLHILNNNMLRIKIGSQKYNIIGTTLWTYVKPEDYGEIQGHMNDYRYIHVREKGKPRGFKVKDMQALHKLAVSCIKRFVTISKKEGANCVLLTHHKPFVEKGDLFSQAYETDMMYMFGDPIRLIAYGHTHQALNKTIKGVKVISNPRGYPRQRTGFKSDFSIYVPKKKSPRKQNTSTRTRRKK